MDTGPPSFTQLQKYYSTITWRKLKTFIDSLKNIGKLKDYNTVFEEWLEEKIVEKVDQTNEIGGEHFLPHRPVFKENSTTKVGQYLMVWLEKRICHR